MVLSWRCLKLKAEPGKPKPTTLNPKHFMVWFALGFLGVPGISRLHRGDHQGVTLIPNNRPALDGNDIKDAENSQVFV